MKMNVEEVRAFLDQEFPQIHQNGREVTILSADAGKATVKLAFDERLLRPGGTISGPVMMELADLAMYVAILSALGPVALAVTTNLNINFLRRPAQRDLEARAALVKLGRRLAVGTVELYSEGMADMVAHATSTYSLPPGNQ